MKKVGTQILIVALGLLISGGGFLLVPQPAQAAAQNPYFNASKLMEKLSSHRKATVTPKQEPRLTQSSSTIRPLKSLEAKSPTVPVKKAVAPTVPPLPKGMVPANAIYNPKSAQGWNCYGDYKQEGNSCLDRAHQSLAQQ